MYSVCLLLVRRADEDENRNDEEEMKCAQSSTYYTAFIQHAHPVIYHPTDTLTKNYHRINRTDFSCSLYAYTHMYLCTQYRTWCALKLTKFGTQTHAVPSSRRAAYLNASSINFGFFKHLTTDICLKIYGSISTLE